MSSGSDPAPRELESTQPGPYRLCFQIASGGMASVYLAIKRGPSGFSKRVALKRVHPHLTEEGEDFVEMFLDEARIASAIHHPNVCAVTDFGEVDGAYFMAMEYLMGESLRRLQRGLSESDIDFRHRELMAARIIARACDGLHAAHELRDDRGQPLHVVHRDVSPQNLMIGFDGSVKVMDFGIAAARNRVHHTETGTVKGKFAYMPPEQLRGHEVDRRADIWALGVLLWETLALKRLFGKGNTSETIIAVLNDPIPPIQSVAPEVSDELAEVVHRALSRDRDERYATAADMSRALRLFLSKSDILMETAELGEHMRELFPDRYAQKQQLGTLATQALSEVPSVGDTGSTHSLSAHGASAVRQRPAPSDTVRRRAIVGAAGAAVLLAVFLAVGLSLSGDDEPAEAPPSAERTPAPVGPPTADPVQPVALHTPESLAPIVEAVDDGVAEEAPPDEAATPPTPMDTPRMVAPMRTRTPAVAGNGSVNVVTPGGWADVYFRGRKIGQTPGRFTLPAGRQRLTLRPFGGAASKNVRVNVRPDQSTRVSQPVTR